MSIIQTSLMGPITRGHRAQGMRHSARAQPHTFIHYGQFRDAYQPSTRLCGNPQSIGRKGKLHVHRAETSVKPTTLERQGKHATVPSMLHKAINF